ncbi:MAG TPA: NADP-dependent oxidoreductase [Baekduia sp.]|uniref:NADP-dependent oxidoreductase n=1 Tax=Baekduia sp. TaxID=2600305 RepID=UPI002C934EF5|nr:NADP-dependent oxidoreductase [Baekduia sp.]HMJ37351.1 NADP-dependent oxidoreductase [Baekduia sp.]
MRAITIDAFGDAGRLQLTERPDPKVGPDSVLIGVRSAGVNPVDIGIREGHLEPFFPHHFPLIPGWDAAGVVEAVGPAVVDLKPGDEVYAYCRKTEVCEGTYAQRVTVPAGVVARVPRTISLLEAGAIPLAGLTAYQALTEALQVRDGDVVLISAAAGGVGHFAVQIAKALGATVIGTASPGHHDALRALGADHVFDYHDNSVADQVRATYPRGVDAALDAIGGETLTQLRESLRQGGRIASLIDTAPAGDRSDLHARYVFVRPSATELGELAKLVGEGRLRVVLAGTFGLEQAAEAQHRLSGHHVHGKLVLEIA